MGALLFDVGALDTKKKSDAAGSVAMHFADGLIQAAVAKELIDCVGEVPTGEICCFATNGRWDMADLLFYLLELSGPAVVTFCTWQINEDAVRKLFNSCEKGLIVELNVLLDRRIKIRRETALEFVKQFSSRISHAVDCHAKVTVIEGAERSFTVFGSANMTTNKRIECGVIFSDKKVAEFNRGWILKQIEGNETFK